MASAWTIESYAAHNEALRMAEGKFNEERDRRYTEVKNAEEKALAIKEKADANALELAREIQSYKDEKANQLREQINSERGHYATKPDLVAAVEKIEAQMQPMLSYISMAQGRRVGEQDYRGTIAWVAAFIMALITIGSFVFRTPAQSAVPVPQIIYVPAVPGTLIPSPAPTQPVPPLPTR